MITRDGRIYEMEENIVEYTIIAINYIGKDIRYRVMKNGSNGYKLGELSFDQLIQSKILKGTNFELGKDGVTGRNVGYFPAIIRDGKVESKMNTVLDLDGSDMYVCNYEGKVIKIKKVDFIKYIQNCKNNMELGKENGYLAIKVGESRRYTRIKKLEEAETEDKQQIKQEIIEEKKEEIKFNSIEDKIIHGDKLEEYQRSVEESRKNHIKILNGSFGIEAIQLYNEIASCVEEIILNETGNTDRLTVPSTIFKYLRYKPIEIISRIEGVEREEAGEIYREDGSYVYVWIKVFERENEVIVYKVGERAGSWEGFIRGIRKEIAEAKFLKLNPEDFNIRQLNNGGSKGEDYWTHTDPQFELTEKQQELLKKYKYILFHIMRDRDKITIPLEILRHIKHYHEKSVELLDGDNSLDARIDVCNMYNEETKSYNLVLIKFILHKKECEVMYVKDTEIDTICNRWKAWRNEVNVA